MRIFTVYGEKCTPSHCLFSCCKICWELDFLGYWLGKFLGWLPGDLNFGVTTSLTTVFGADFLLASSDLNLGATTSLTTVFRVDFLVDHLGTLILAPQRR